MFKGIAVFFLLVALAAVITLALDWFVGEVLLGDNRDD